MWETYFLQFLEQDFPRFLQEKPWNYKDDLCMVGCYDLYKASGEEKWLSYMLENARYLMQEDGSVVNWKPSEHNADKVSFGKSLRLLRDLTGEKRYAEAVKKAYAMLEDYPRTVTGNFWHKDIYREQVWLDGLYMILPFYAGCLAENGTDLWDDIIDQFLKADQLLWEEKLGLHVHACDVSRSMYWADPETGKSPAVWLRAEGWFLMALCDVYEIAEKHTERAKELIALLQKTADGILAYEQPQTHMFLQVPDRGELEGNYPETSGSAMAAYALMKGARLHMLAPSYGQKGEEILEGIKSTYLKEETDESSFTQGRDDTSTAPRLHLHGICASAGLGVSPDTGKDRSGQPEYYLSEARMPDNQHGAAACMMAYSELLYRKHDS